VTAKQRFEPAQKFRIELKTIKYSKLKEVQVFPPAGTKFDLGKPLTSA